MLKRAGAVFLMAVLLLAACSDDVVPVPVISPSANLFTLEGDFRGVQTLAELMDLPEDTALVLYTHHGGIIQANAATEVEARQGKIFIQNDQSLQGIVLDPPTQTITYAYSWALAQVQAGNPALVVLIDGLGYEVYAQALDQGIIPSLASGEALPALTVSRPVTNAGLSAILTGQTPDKSGIHDRKDRQPQVPDILNALSDMGKTGLVVEGGINILDLEGEVVLNPDGNGDGYADDDILAAALARMDSGYDYMLVHFHSLDDAGHSYGPWAVETMDRLKVLDQYFQELRQAWHGPVLVVSDHGMHKKNEGGEHGEFRYEDIFVPVITFPWEVKE